jgi:hypothetical protein
LESLGNIFMFNLVGSYVVPRFCHADRALIIQ